MLSSGAVGADWSWSPSGALDQWRQGVLIQLEPAPVMEIVITEQSRARPQPGRGRQSDNLPLTINNHHPPPHHHSRVSGSLAEFLHITEKWHGVLYFAARNPKKSEKETTRPAEIIWIAFRVENSIPVGGY